MTLDEILNIVKTPITTFKNGAVIQKLLLGACALGDETLAAKRALALLENVELRAMFLLMYPNVSLTSEELDNSEELISVKDVLTPYIKIAQRAISELEVNLPLETVALLKDYFVKESPIHFVTVNIFVVVTMTLIEAGEL